MFALPDYDFSSYLDMLLLHKSVYDSIGSVTGDTLCPDYIYEEYFCAIQNVCSDVYWFEPELYEGNTVFLFPYDNFSTFYSLCHIHSRQAGVNFKKDPFVIEAEEAVDSILNGIQDYSFAWRLNVPKKIVKKKSYYLLIETTYDFFRHSELVQALYEIRNFYLDAERRLRKELQVLQMPKREKSRKATSERRAA